LTDEVGELSQAMLADVALLPLNMVQREAKARQWAPEARRGSAAVGRRRAGGAALPQRRGRGRAVLVLA
jgi:hypothetical protein